MPGSVFNWNLTGGTIAADFGDSALVDWGDLAGLFSLSVEETSVLGCESEPLTLQVQAGGPTVDLGNEQNFCEGTTVTIIPAGSFTIHMWHDGSTAPSYSTDTSEQVGIQVFDDAGCTVSDSVQLTVYPVPLVDLGNDTTLCGPASLILDAGNPGAIYEWSTGETSQQIEVFAGAQTISVTVAYNIDCPGSAALTISACSGGGMLENIPNLFTPNGDGKNDTWWFNEAAFFPDMVVEIFNRWGKRVYISEPGYPDPWDGTSMNGTRLPMDSYHYIIKLNEGDEEVVGTVTIVR